MERDNVEYLLVIMRDYDGNEHWLIPIDVITDKQMFMLYNHKRLTPTEWLNTFKAGLLDSTWSDYRIDRIGNDDIVIEEHISKVYFI